MDVSDHESVDISNVNVLPCYSMYSDQTEGRRWTKDDVCLGLSPHGALVVTNLCYSSPIKASIQKIMIE